MWVDDYSPELGIYAARCEFLKPGWLDMRQRIIDIGFLGKLFFDKIKDIMRHHSLFPVFSGTVIVYI
jgi:hypothetical protein